MKPSSEEAGTQFFRILMWRSAVASKNGCRHEMLIVVGVFAMFLVPAMNMLTLNHMDQFFNRWCLRFFDNYFMA